MINMFKLKENQFIIEYTQTIKLNKRKKDTKTYIYPEIMLPYDIYSYWTQILNKTVEYISLIYDNDSFIITPNKIDKAITIKLHTRTNRKYSTIRLPKSKINYHNQIKIVINPYEVDPYTNKLGTVRIFGLNLIKDMDN